MPAVTPEPNPHLGGPILSEDILKANERLVTSSFDQAKAYSQIVLGIGYVSIFAAWSFAKEFISRDQALWSALLASLSVFVFVLFEVFSMFVTSRTLLALVAATQQPQNFHRVLEEWRKKDAKLVRSYGRCWVWCWFFCVITGVGSAFILLGAFVGALLAR
jgi:hypothetical protein